MKTEWRVVNGVIVDWQAAALSGGRNFDFSCEASGFGNRFSEILKRSDVPLDRLPNISLGLFQACACRNATGQVWNVGSPVVLGLLKNDSILPPHRLTSSPAAFRMDFSVPTGKSSPGCPGT